jgi:hypothetical protein
MGEHKECGSPPVRKDPRWLLVKVNSNGRMVTTVGHGIFPKGEGPIMDFDPSPAKGMKDPAANMAHEIG